MREIQGNLDSLRGNGPALRTKSTMKRHRRGHRLTDLAQKTGPPLTTRELAVLIGMSTTFIRKEICSGYLRATRIGRGRKPVFRIALREARRYVRKLGLL